MNSTAAPVPPQASKTFLKAFLPLIISVCIFLLLAAVDVFQVLTYEQPRQVSRPGQMTLGEIFSPRPTVDKVQLMVIVVVSFIVRTVLSAIYFIPTVIAAFRQSRHYLWIILTNIFAGWTILGWIGALVWAFLSKPPSSEPVTLST